MTTPSRVLIHVNYTDSHNSNAVNPEGVHAHKNRRKPDVCTVS